LSQNLHFYISARCVWWVTLFCKPIGDTPMTGNVYIKSSRESDEDIITCLPVEFAAAVAAQKAAAAKTPEDKVTEIMQLLDQSNGDKAAFESALKNYFGVEKTHPRPRSDGSASAQRLSRP
jgi:hypothetical protein